MQFEGEGGLTSSDLKCSCLLGYVNISIMLQTCILVKIKEQRKMVYGNIKYDTQLFEKLIFGLPFSLGNFLPQKSIS